MLFINFVFQILPQLLYYFGVKDEDHSLDWATIVVYTCEASCEGIDYSCLYGLDWIPKWLHLAGNPFCLRVEATHQTSNGGQALFSQLIHCWYRQNCKCSCNPLLIKRLIGDFHVSMNKTEHFHVNVKCRESSLTTVENKPVWRTKKYSYGIMRQEWLKEIQSPN
ncbi:uncharacterized protein LOC110415514 [Herrania umbratica]|uniref:Uncharacterized protein LOC110415514 n=1 Tax=Herrania umbratica TaxID=108875 RepID=A0A6J1A7P1_9ROSI|nr:uncharacterized protein LOC110415514 [Herrania umbratica]